MIYLIAVSGLIFGFVIGQSMIYFLLSDTPADVIKNDKDLKIKYGLLNWVIAIIFAWLAVMFFG